MKKFGATKRFGSCYYFEGKSPSHAKVAKKNLPQIFVRMGGPWRSDCSKLVGCEMARDL